MIPGEGIDDQLRRVNELNDKMFERASLIYWSCNNDWAVYFTAGRLKSAVC